MSTRRFLFALSQSLGAARKQKFKIFDTAKRERKKVAYMRMYKEAYTYKQHQTERVCASELLSLKSCMAVSV